MSKICPNCHEIFDDNAQFCAFCLTRLEESPEKQNPTFSLGDANAISGGVSINQSKNITSHDTHYHSTTVHERSKSESELKLDANNQLRSKAEEIMAERGRIDSIAMNQLRPLSLQLGIDEETFKSIIKDVRSNRNGNTGGLSAANARYLQQAQQAIKTNDMDALSVLTARLEAMAAISQDDNVQFMHYLTYSLFYPLKSMDMYEHQTDENYWRTFWAIISYIRTGKYDEATSTLALFDPLRYEKSEDDQNLLEAYFNIMKEDKDGAQDFLDEILGEPTEQVKPLLRAVESTLYEEDAESLEVRFYMERVMTKSDVVVKSQKTVESSASVEESVKKDSKPEFASKDNKEADELYAKAGAASGIKRVMLLQKAADAGSLDAMFDLGDCYFDGEGVEKNMPLAIKWMTKAADGGHTLAQAALGGTYFFGAEGLDQNYTLSEKYLLMAAEKANGEAQGFLSALYVATEEYDKALQWARKGAQTSNPMAYYMLGRIYSEGLGVEANDLEGLKWYEQAANHGDADAQNICGNIYHDADFVEHDYGKAFKYYQMAAAQGHLWGMYNLGYCYQNGDGTEPNILAAEEWIQKAADSGLEEAQKMLEEMSGNQVEDADLISAKEAYDNGDYDTALEIWRELAEKDKDNYEAIRKIGLCYYLGHGVPLDYTEALKWYKKASELGDAQAMVNIGLCYSNGQGVTQNHKEAFKWFKKAAELGNEKGLLLLGDSYLFGNGVKQNYKEAVECYHKSADMGNARAMYNLGIGYRNGDGVAQDYNEAAFWFRKAADLGYVDAMNNLGLCFENGEGVDQDYNEAANWFRKAADLGHADAMNNLGLCFENGEGVDQDYNEATKWYRKAADLGNAFAMNNLGLCFENGEGVAQDYNEAAEWYRKAADLGHTDAMTNLGDCYLYGNGVSQNHKEADKWYKKAGELGNADAYMRLADTSESPAEAVQWWLKAAELGEAEACRNLGVYYESSDIKAAAEWCQKALDNGYEDKDGKIGSILNNLKKAEQDVEIIKVWADNINGRKEISIHFDAKLNKKTNHICVIAVPTTQDNFDFLADEDYYGYGYRGAHFNIPKSNKELKNHYFSFTEKELSSSFDAGDGYPTVDGIYSVKMALVGFCCTDSDRDFDDKVKKALKKPLFIYTLKFKLTTHLFSACDIEVIR